MNDDRPDAGDLVNDSIVDDVVDVMDTLEWCYNELSRIPGWYNLIKANDKQAARFLIKFFFLVREEWLEYGRSQHKIGAFGLVKESDTGPVNLDQLPY